MNIQHLNIQAKMAITLFLGFVIVATVSSVILLGLALTGEKSGLKIPTVGQISKKYGTSMLVGSMHGSMKEFVSALEDIEVVEQWIKEGAKKETPLFKEVETIIRYDCRNCHSRTSTMTRAIRSIPFEKYEDIVAYTEVGYSWKQMSKQAHIHMYGIASFLIFVTLLFAYTTYKEWVRSALIVLSFSAGFIDIFSWWFIKEIPALAYAIYGFGSVMVGSILLMSALILLDAWKLPRPFKA
ncbi:MAG: hypothetical protein IBX45_10090 [Campylobacterales bacterium]|nr:hypothetical protein [Campylobacterales bacterium]